MILVELHLENYKQYAGSQVIEFPPEGAVAIIGSNGVGKTTLFEAIEWCLYNPRQIPNDELPPRGGVGDTRVKLVLEDPQSQVRYVIERTRRRRGVEAEVYRWDQNDVPIVKGTRDVTAYVTQHLIGLSHRAFVSTFFTRQKELSFFGDLRDTERRREVAQLLGFETIRTAQAIIGDDRAAARSEYQALARQYDDEMNGRDLVAELATADAAIAGALAAEAAALRDVETSDAAHQSSRRELAEWSELERQHALLSQHVERLSGELSTARANQHNAEANLARLAQLDNDRLQLLPSRDAAPGLREDGLRHEAERERFRHAHALTAAIDRAAAEITAIGPRAAKLVRGVDASVLLLPGWDWTTADNGHLAGGLDRLHTLTGRLDPVAESRQAEAIRNLVQAAADRDAARTKADRYRKALDDRTRELDALLAAGEPAAAIAGLETKRAESQRAEQAAIAAERQCAKEQTQLAHTIAAIEAAAKEPECPTCHRPLSRQDAQLAIAPLQLRIEELAASQDAAKRDAASAHGCIAQIEQDLARQRERQAKAQELAGRIDQGTTLVSETEDDAQRRAANCREQLLALGRDREPTPEEARATVQRAETVRTVASLGSLIGSLRDQLANATVQQADARAELDGLGRVAYDRAAHEAAEQALATAQANIARLQQIDQELTHRGGYESERATAQAIGARIAADLEETEERRLGLGFDPAQLELATATEQAAAVRVREADRAVAAARGHLQSVRHTREAIVADQARIANLARRSELRRREHDELDRMYREFARFDQHVAQLVTPQLADYTGELLAEVTDHKYDHVTFDDNYGLRVFDGPEDFSIDQFSGGERDVAALCARLALSRFIGAQAAHPPRFLVLDEVFGSLDADRRIQVLGTLLKLAGADGPFRQLFIISHVDDVRQSPLLDEVWRVHEIDGASKVENVSRSGNADDL